MLDGLYDTVRLLLKQPGIDVNQRGGPEGDSLLIMVARALIPSHANGEKLLMIGKTSNRTSHSSRHTRPPPLQCPFTTARSGCILVDEQLRLLANVFGVVHDDGTPKADVTLTSALGYTALAAATQCKPVAGRVDGITWVFIHVCVCVCVVGFEAIVRQLLLRGAPVDATTPRGETPLMIAAQRRSCRVAYTPSLTRLVVAC